MSVAVDMIWPHSFTDYDTDNGQFNGYVPAGRRVYVSFSAATFQLFLIQTSLDAASGLRDRVEIYNIPSTSTFAGRFASAHTLTIFAEFNGDFKHEHPAVVQDNIAEIDEFARVMRSSKYFILCTQLTPFLVPSHRSA